MRQADREYAIFGSRASDDVFRPLGRHGKTAIDVGAHIRLHR